jgi:hypothetical protein
MWVENTEKHRIRISEEDQAYPLLATLIKKKIKLSPYIRKFILEQLQSHI